MDYKEIKIIVESINLIDKSVDMLNEIMPKSDDNTKAYYNLLMATSVLGKDLLKTLIK